MPVDIDPNKLTEHDDPRDLYQEQPTQQEIADGINQLEAHANQQPKDTLGAKEREDLRQKPDFYQPDEAAAPTGFLGRVRQRRRALIGGGGALVLLAGGFGAVTFFTQPFQMLQFAKLLQQAHTLGNVEYSDRRGFMAIKYALTRDAKEQRNLGYLGNKFADKYEADFRAAGLDPDYTDPAGRSRRSIQGFNIDPTTTEGQQAIKNMRERGLVDGDFQSLPDGRVRVDLRGEGGTRKTRIVFEGALDSIRLNSRIERLGRRVVLGKRMRRGNLLSPLKNRVREANETRQDYRKRIIKEDTERIRSGVEPNQRRLDGAEDEEGNPDPEADNAADAGNELTDEIGDLDPDSPEGQRSLAQRLTGGGAALALGSVLCLVNDMGN